MNSKSVVRRHFEEVWNQGKFDALKELYDETYQGQVPLVGMTDRDGLKAVVTAYRRAFPDLRFEITSLIQEGDRVAVQWRASGTSQGEFMGLPATHTVGTVDGLSMIEIRNGKIFRDIAEMDVMSLFQQMGLQMPINAREPAPTR